MNRTIESIENRIRLLEQRDPVANTHIVAKLRRKLRSMKK
jgi:hypothetical protein